MLRSCSYFVAFVFLLFCFSKSRMLPWKKKYRRRRKEGGKQFKYSTQAGCSHAALEIRVQSDLQCSSVNLEL